MFIPQYARALDNARGGRAERSQGLIVARPREFEESAVLDAAMHLFWRSGYAATSVADLCKATGLGAGSLYAAYGDKRGLFIAALRRYAERVSARAIAALENLEHRGASGADPCTGDGAGIAFIGSPRISR